MHRLSWVLLIISFFTISCSDTIKTAYVDNYKLFEGFKGKLELETRYKHEGLQKQQLLDSMKIKLIGMKQSNSLPIEKVQAYEQEYAQMLNKFGNEIEEQKAEYTSEVWKQINQYTFDYGKEKGFDYIFGSAGNGSLMYAASAKDVTNEVLEYINKRYEGKK